MITYPASISGDACLIYPYVRRAHPDLSATQALAYARHEASIDLIESELIDSTDHDPYRDGGLLWAGVLPDGIEIRAYADDEPFDWGDHDASDDERENLSVIGVGVRIAGDDEDAPQTYLSMGRDGQYHPHVGTCTVWGYGFTDGTIERNTISCAIESGFIDAARAEMSERAYWLDREVQTV